MNPEAESVRSVMLWAHRMVQEDEGQGSIPVPGLQQVSIFRMFSRADPETAFTLAMDLIDIQPHRIMSEASTISSRELNDVRGESRHQRTRVAVDALESCERLIDRARTAFTGESAILFDHGCRFKTWKRIEAHWPGRAWHSLRDDWEALALRFWRREHRMICRAMEYFFFTLCENPPIVTTIPTFVTERNAHSSGSI